jgi:hypothetical protein
MDLNKKYTVKDRESIKLRPNLLKKEYDDFTKTIKIVYLAFIGRISASFRTSEYIELRMGMSADDAVGAVFHELYTSPERYTPFHDEGFFRSPIRLQRFIVKCALNSYIRRTEGMQHKKSIKKSSKFLEKITRTQAGLDDIDETDEMLVYQKHLKLKAKDIKAMIMNSKLSASECLVIVNMLAFNKTSAFIENDLNLTRQAVNFHKQNAIKKMKKFVEKERIKFK